MPLTLVVHAANHGYSSANNSGAAVARARHLLFLNSDVIPDRSGWLPLLCAELEASPRNRRRRPQAAVRGRLAPARRPVLRPRLQGPLDQPALPQGHAARLRPRLPAPRRPRRHGSLPADAGATCSDEIGGFTRDYIIGDYEDSDLCLKIRAAGREIRYVPAAELYHLERQSISRHAGYTRGVASEYNAWLHAGRWSGLMEDLMNRDWTAERQLSSPASKRRNRSRKAPAAA